ncbi:hypothetical protein [Plantactinospora sp. B5E13]|uniref:hypothetical protein n=1 Tax=unclassified Plantactinospora TaxID=2631981 RepID=UPI00325D4A39
MGDMRSGNTTSDPAGVTATDRSSAPGLERADGQGAASRSGSGTFGRRLRGRPVPLAAAAAVAAVAGVVVERRRRRAAARRAEGWNVDRLIRLARPVAPWWSAAAGSVRRISGSRLAQTATRRGRS